MTTETISPGQPWAAQMIAADTDHGSAPAFRRQVVLDQGHGSVASARLYASALGICEVTLNGHVVTDDLLSPGWTSYEWRLRYTDWDVTHLIESTTVVGIVVGNGWYHGYLGYAGNRNVYGGERAAFAELRITFADGHAQTVVTDDAWESGPTEILQDDLYNGETIDAARVDHAWQHPGAALPGWSGVRAVEFDTARLTPYIAPPVRRQESLTPQRVWRSPAGKTLLDFGQNLVGWLRVDVQGQAGTELVLRHAEVLEHEELGVRPLRRAEATDRFVLSGNHDQFEPRFTFHGFRYAEIEGWTGTDEELAESVEAVVIGSDLRRIGTFECSDPLLNQLHANVVWGMRGNFVDVPTDCPQRDERLGWTGDIAAFATTATFLYDVDTFLQDWLRDLAVEQRHGHGNIPLVVPDILKYEDQSAAAAESGIDLSQIDMSNIPPVALWADAAVWVPWAIWEAYGDRTVLEAQYASITSYVHKIQSALSERGVLDTGMQLGDWLDPTAPPENPMAAKADGNVVATACVYRSVVLASRIASILGHEEDAASFGAQADQQRDAFRAQYVTDDGRIASDAEAVYALAIAFGLLDEVTAQRAGDRLAELVAESGHHITTGFAGTPFILGALSQTGHLDTAYRLLMQREVPSWLFPVTMGATTVWERWDSMLPDGSINPGEMTSFNHYAFGAVADWMHRTIAGIAPLEPGYRTMLIAPQPGGGVTSARATLLTPHGELAVAWEVVDAQLSLDVTVPDGSSAVVRLPDGSQTKVGSGRHRHIGTLP